MRGAAVTQPGTPSGTTGSGCRSASGTSGASGAFLPGGPGFPVTGSGPIGLGRVDGAPVGWEGNSTRAAGQRCALAGSRLRQGRTPAGASAGLGCIGPARADPSTHLPGCVVVGPAQPSAERRTT